MSLNKPLPNPPYPYYPQGVVRQVKRTKALPKLRKRRGKRQSFARERRQEEIFKFGQIRSGYEGLATFRPPQQSRRQQAVQGFFEFHKQAIKNKVRDDAETDRELKKQNLKLDKQRQTKAEQQAEKSLKLQETQLRANVLRAEAEQQGRARQQQLLIGLGSELLRQQDIRERRQGELTERIIGLQKAAGTPDIRFEEMNLEEAVSKGASVDASLSRQTSLKSQPSVGSDIEGFTAQHQRRKVGTPQPRPKNTKPTIKGTFKKLGRRRVAPAEGGGVGTPEFEEARRGLQQTINPLEGAGVGFTAPSPEPETLTREKTPQEERPKRESDLEIMIRQEEAKASIDDERNASRLSEVLADGGIDLRGGSEGQKPPSVADTTAKAQRKRKSKTPNIGQTILQDPSSRLAERREGGAWTPSNITIVDKVGQFGSKRKNDKYYIMEIKDDYFQLVNHANEVGGYNGWNRLGKAKYSNYLDKGYIDVFDE